MHSVQIGTQRKHVAATWNELSPEQLLRLLPVLYGHYPNETAQRLHLLPVLLGITPLSLLRFTPVQLVEIKWLADFLLTGPVTLTTQLLPQLNGRWYQRPLWGPADELGGVCFLEFAFADAYFVAFANDQQQDKWLDHLVAALYRPQRRPYRPQAPDYAGDRREPFNEHLLDSRLPRVARLPRLVKLAVFTYYRGCRHALEQRYPHVFTPAQQGEAQAHPDGWAHVLRELSGQAFGNYAETGRQALDVVLAKMNDDLARAEQLRREHEAQQHAC
ncbi:MAG: hypothetical protein ACRYFX_19560 [Janthinobacterium lividum]